MLLKASALSFTEEEILKLVELKPAFVSVNVVFSFMLLCANIICETNTQQAKNSAFTSNRKYDKIKRLKQTTF